EASLAGEAVAWAAETYGDVTQGAVVHVHHATPADAAASEIQRIAPIDMVIDHRAEQVVRGSDGVEVTGEVEVDVFHRDYLGVTAASCAAFDTEAGAEARFAQADGRFLADAAEAVTQAYGGGGLAFIS